MTAAPFPTPVVLSLTTGKLVCDFPDMHRLAEHLMGHPIWTHQFADRDLWGKMRESVYQQHPSLRAAEEESEAVDRENWEDIRDTWVVRYGRDLLIRSIEAERTEDPVTSAVRIVREIKERPWPPPR